jgi:hypothetical protein
LRATGSIHGCDEWVIANRLAAIVENLPPARWQAFIARLAYLVTEDRSYEEAGDESRLFEWLGDDGRGRTHFSPSTFPIAM